MGKASRRLRSPPSSSGLKAAFDEHVPTALAKAIISFAKEKMIQRISRGIVWETAASYAPKPTDGDYVRKSDVPWLDRFAAAGGRAVISGDVKMRHRPHEKLALHGHGFVVIFFEEQWGKWTSLQRTALMLHWWKEIATKIRSAENGTFWIVPSNFPSKGELRNASLGLAKLLKDNPDRQRPARPKKPSTAKPKSPDPRQASLLDAPKASQP